MGGSIGVRRLGGVVLAALVLTAGEAAAQGRQELGQSCPRLATTRVDWGVSDAVQLARSILDRAQRDNVAAAGMLNEIASAKGACTAAATANRRTANPIAYACAAEASQLLARHSLDPGARAALYQEAYCGYQAVLGLAGSAEGEPQRSARLAAMEGQARVQEARAALGGPDSSRYLYAAIDGYAKVAQAAPTQQRYLALARSQRAAGQNDAALASYAQLQALPTGPNFSVKDQAMALREQARLAASLPGAAPATLRALWDKANRLETTPEAAFEFAKTFYDAGDFNAAEAAFNAVPDAPQLDTAGYRRQADYFSALILARSAATPAQWSQVLERVRRAGTSRFEYRRLACISYLARGGEDLARDDELATCVGDGGAEGQLLRGLYYLRRAQFLPPSCRDPVTRRDPCKETILQRWNDSLTMASDAFRRGRAAAGDSLLDWGLGWWPAAQAPKLGEALDFGDAVFVTVSRRCDVSVRADRGAAGNIYERLDLVFDAGGSGYLARCKPSR